MTMSPHPPVSWMTWSWSSTVALECSTTAKRACPAGNAVLAESPALRTLRLQETSPQRPDNHLPRQTTAQDSRINPLLRGLLTVANRLLNQDMTSQRSKSRPVPPPRSRPGSPHSKKQTLLPPEFPHNPALPLSQKYRAVPIREKPCLHPLSEPANPTGKITSPQNPPSGPGPRRAAPLPRSFPDIPRRKRTPPFHPRILHPASHPCISNALAPHPDWPLACS